MGSGGEAPPGHLKGGRTNLGSIERGGCGVPELARCLRALRVVAGLSVLASHFCAGRLVPGQVPVVSRSGPGHVLVMASVPAGWFLVSFHLLRTKKMKRCPATRGGSAHCEQTRAVCIPTQ